MNVYKTININREKRRKCKLIDINIPRLCLGFLSYRKKKIINQIYSYEIWYLNNT